MKGVYHIMRTLFETPELEISEFHTEDILKGDISLPDDNF